MDNIAKTEATRTRVLTMVEEVQSLNNYVLSINDIVNTVANRLHGEIPCSPPSDAPVGTNGDMEHLTYMLQVIRESIQDLEASVGRLGDM